MEKITFDKALGVDELIALCEEVNPGIGLGVVNSSCIQFQEEDRGKVTASLDRLGIKYPKNVEEAGCERCGDLDDNGDTCGLCGCCAACCACYDE